MMGYGGKNDATWIKPQILFKGLPPGWLKPSRGSCVKNIVSVPSIRGEIVFWLALI